jgi:hypothetical protein
MGGGSTNSDEKLMKDKLMKNKVRLVHLPCLFAGACLIIFSTAAAATAQDAKPAVEPWKRQVYFGEQHLHTSASPDAFVIGVRGDWEDAYNYAMGKEITLSTTGAKIKKSTPYDWFAITDHAEYFGVMPRLIEPKDPLSNTPLAKQLQDPNADVGAPDSAINKILGSLITSTPMKEFVTPELLASNWKRYVKRQTSSTSRANSRP